MHGIVEGDAVLEGAGAVRVAPVTGQAGRPGADQGFEQLFDACTEIVGARALGVD
jgi:hypothetical protein